MTRMNEDTPKVDMFGMSIDYGDTYYITHDEKVVHCLNLDEYMLSINAQEFKKED
jgi:hypothetical protein